MTRNLRQILLVDDDTVTNTLHEIVLKRSLPDASITITKNGQEALGHIRQVREANAWPDLILLDVNMPVMNGWEFLEALQGIDDRPDDMVVVVLLGADLRRADATRSSNMQIEHHFLEKPLTRDKISTLSSRFFTT